MCPHALQCLALTASASSASAAAVQDYVQAGLAFQLAVELSLQEASFEEALDWVVSHLPLEAATALQVLVSPQLRTDLLTCALLCSHTAAALSARPAMPVPGNSLCSAAGYHQCCPAALRTATAGLGHSTQLRAAADLIHTSHLKCQCRQAAAQV